MKRPTDFISSLRFPANQLWSGWSLAIAALGFCWLLFFNAVRGEWQINPQYSYGFIVPVLWAVLFSRRWTNRPATAPGNGWIAALLAAPLLLLWLPWTLAIEANPEWRLLYWINGLQVVGLSFCLFYRFGGWKWVRHFAAAITFIFLAIPWPMGLEQGGIQHLMRFVASLTVELAGLLGIPAVQHGNLIEVGAGLIGIDEACSGVRSLQSALMLSLFLGEMHLLSWTRRAVLLGGSFVFVVTANLCRTTFLVWAAATHGLHQMEAWHDTAGNLVMFIVVPGLVGLGHIMRRREPEIPVAAAPSAASGLSRWVGISALAWIALCLMLSELWYRSHESRLAPSAQWTVTWPEWKPQFKRTAVPANSLAILRCSDSDAGVWQDDEGNQWNAFLLEWKPGKNSAQLAKGHRPDICFPAAGANLVENFGRVNLTANGLEMSFQHQTFQCGSQLMHVFYCLWADRKSQARDALLEDGSQASRIAAVLAGQRNLGQRVLEITVQGPESEEKAIDLLKTELPLLIKRHSDVARE